MVQPNIIDFDHHRRASAIRIDHLLKSLLHTLFSFEMLFVVFLFAGVFKSDPRFSWIPMDITMLTLGLGVLVSIFVLMKRKFIVLWDSYMVTAIYLLLAAYAMLSLIWSPSQIYATDKVSKMLTLVLWSIIGSSWIIASEPKRVQRFIMALGIFSLWIAGEGILTYAASGGKGFVNVMGGTYLGAGQISSLGAIVFMWQLLFGQREALYKLFSLFSFGICMFHLFVGGGRGPLLATFLSLLLPMLYSIRLEHNRMYVRRYSLLLLAMIAGAISTAVIWSASPNPPQTLLRLSLLMPGSDGIGGSASARVSYAGEAGDYWLRSPLRGNGIGSWPVLSQMDDFRDYPHNLFIEVMVELGGIGLLLLALLIGITIRYAILILKSAQSERWIVLVMIFIAMLFNVTVSGDIPDNRAFFAVIGLLPVITKAGLLAAREEEHSIAHR
ncbi:O-antigen polymerase [Paenibacillus alvei TS-15]|jgi:O-antigen ligase|uniref:O-antigen polymerase n=1 Tax=Paenibacillus alvei TS-15 TaxID=1117108 RepID=S9SN57_PAEAL|nr:O-antigen ligase family protein [Paenibacillus alvei]EPY07187.1 O-antigen polymerase [Paenibacillus alvei TS-15]